MRPVDRAQEHETTWEYELRLHLHPFCPPFFETMSASCRGGLGNSTRIRVSRRERRADPPPALYGSQNLVTARERGIYVSGTRM